VFEIQEVSGGTALVASAVGLNTNWVGSGGSTITSRTIGGGSSSANFWYYDEKAGDWTINITASDAGSLTGENSSTNFILQSTGCVVLSPGAMTWQGLFANNLNNLAYNNPITINNTCNANNNVSVQAYDLHGNTTSSEIIPAANFTVSISNACDVGAAMVNGSIVNVIGAVLSPGNNSLAFGNETSGQESLYICLEHVPAGLSDQVYSTLSDWAVAFALVVFVVAGRRKRRNS